MKSRWRDKNSGEGKSGGEEGRRDDGVMFMRRRIEVVKENKVVEMKEGARPWPLNVIS